MTNMAEKFVSTKLPADHFMAAFTNNGVDGLPANWREVPAADFAQSHFFIYSPEWFDFIQAVIPSMGKAPQSIRMFYMHDGTGYAMVSDYWKKEVHYFTFGCDHAYVGLSQEECRKRKIAHFGRCYSVSECSKCKHVRSIDSSD